MTLHKLPHYLALATIVVALNLLGIRLMAAAHDSLFPQAAAEEELMFAHALPHRLIVLPTTKEAAMDKTPDFDLDKLAKAVAMHETLDCKARAGAALVNNCFGIMSWDSKGRRYFRPFKTKEDSYTEFKRIWSTFYKKFPDYNLARRYSGNDRVNAWLGNVTRYYAEL